MTPENKASLLVFTYQLDNSLSIYISTAVEGLC